MFYITFCRAASSILYRSILVVVFFSFLSLSPITDVFVCLLFFDIPATLFLGCSYRVVDDERSAELFCESGKERGGIFFLDDGLYI